MSKKFQKNKENFTCQKCGEYTEGDGYTNHCPKCLWSKHVDKNPGDRREKCAGMMEPISIEKELEDYVILHKCVSCGHTKRNKMSKDDSFGAAAKV